MNYSKQRERVLNALAEKRNHPTADELYAYLKAQQCSMSPATVYRNLHQLADNGVVMRLSVPGGAERYDPVNDGHLHMICSECGGISDIPANAICDVVSQARKATGYNVNSCSIMFYGVCKDCES
ncbi:MAG: transcriptional repressor [Clostridia bacterium]|nr:transcriptional repressor [Clostridia bacterium]